ncbi:MAG: sensor histidine kinase, partial [Bacteroidales bacterium]
KELLNFKDQFVSIISHDLRSPIGAVIGLTDLLLDDETLIKKLDQGQSELLSDIKNEMLRLLDYNDKLYQWSNLELGNFKVSRKSIHPKHLAKYVEKMQSVRMKEKNIHFISHIATGFAFEADETLLGQALNNLVGNSVKFTPEGGTIHLSFVMDSTSKCIVVSDSGQGMDQETCDRLFSGFTRKTTMGTYGEKGTGLGLGIVKKIIDAHGFTIHVESVPGTGTTFTIRLNE